MMHFSYVHTQTVLITLMGSRTSRDDIRECLGRLVQLMGAPDVNVRVDAACKLVARAIVCETEGDISTDKLYQHYAEYFSPAELSVLGQFTLSLLTCRPFTYVNLNTGMGLLVRDDE